jgi:hypothetical protein
MPNKTVLNTELNKNQFVQRLLRTAGSCAEAGVLVRKLSQLIPLSSAKRGYFIMFCGISCEKAGCVHRPIVDSESRCRSFSQKIETANPAQLS